MMRRRIFLWMGLSVLYAVSSLCLPALSGATFQNQFSAELVDFSGINDDTSLNGDEASTKQSDSATSDPRRMTHLVQKKNAAAIQSTRSRPATYSVRQGDTLARIAKKTGVSISELRELNHLKGTFLKTGQQLTLLRGKDPGHRGSLAEEEDPLDDLEEEDGGLPYAPSGIENHRQKRDRESLMGSWTHPEEPQMLVKVAMGFLGAPYRLGGSSATGIDCSAFVKKIYQLFNIDLPRTAYEQSFVGLRIARDELLAGDLLFFNTRRKLGHVGIYIGNNEFVHASSRKRGVRVDNLSTPYFNRRFVKAVRLKENENGH